MNYKIIRPFIEEMIVFVLVISGVFLGLLTTNLIEIIIHTHLLTIVAIVLVFSSLITQFSRIVPTGIGAIIDYLFRGIKEDKYTFIKIQPYRASVFSEKFDRNHERSFGMYYLIHVKKEEKIYTFISSYYVDLLEGEVYTIQSGRSSKIFLNSFSTDGVVR